MPPRERERASSIRFLTWRVSKESRNFSHNPYNQVKVVGTIMLIETVMNWWWHGCRDLVGVDDDSIRCVDEEFWNNSTTLELAVGGWTWWWWLRFTIWWMIRNLTPIESRWWGWRSTSLMGYDLKFMRKIMRGIAHVTKMW